MVKHFSTFLAMFIIALVTWAQPVVNGPPGDDLSISHNRYKLLDPNKRDAFLKLDGLTRDLMEKVKELVQDCPVKIQYPITIPSKFYLYLFSRNLHTLPTGKDKDHGKRKSKGKDQKICSKDAAQEFYDCVIQKGTLDILGKMVVEPYYSSYLQFNYDQTINEAANTIKFLETLIRENKK